MPVVDPTYRYSTDRALPFGVRSKSLRMQRDSSAELQLLSNSRRKLIVGRNTHTIDTNITGFLTWADSVTILEPSNRGSPYVFVRKRLFRRTMIRERTAYPPVSPPPYSHTRTGTSGEVALSPTSSGRQMFNVRQSSLCVYFELDFP